MIKLAIFDLDGTLLNKKHDISEANLRAVKLLQSKGVAIAIATGRPELMIQEYIDLLKIKGPVITCNGSVLGNPQSDCRLFARKISSVCVNRIIEYCENQGHLIMAYTDSKIVTHENERVKLFEARNLNLPEAYKIKFHITDDLARECETIEVRKLIIIERDSTKNSCLLNWLNAQDDISEITVTQSASGFIDIMPPHTSKMEALIKLATYHKVTPDEIVAFGDQMNDLEMLEFAGTAITTDNGVPEVKAICDYISLNHDADGVAYAIENYLFNNRKG